MHPSYEKLHWQAILKELQTEIYIRKRELCHSLRKAQQQNISANKE